MHMDVDIVGKSLPQSLHPVSQFPPFRPTPVAPGSPERYVPRLCLHHSPHSHPSAAPQLTPSLMLAVLTLSAFAYFEGLSFNCSHWSHLVPAVSPEAGLARVHARDSWPESRGQDPGRKVEASSSSRTSSKASGLL